MHQRTYVILLEGPSDGPTEPCIFRICLLSVVSLFVGGSVRPFEATCDVCK